MKIRNGIAPHSGAFPAIFTYMNSLLQNDLMGRNMKDIHPDLPSGIIKYQEGWLRSKPVKGAEQCFVQGRFDVLVELEDETYSVIDFKITKPKEEHIQKYSTQLHAYKYALENPDNGDEQVKISQMGLVSISPDDIYYEDGKVFFKASPVWHPVQENMNNFYSFVFEIQNVLNGPVPPKSTDCSLCRYRSSYSSLNEADSI